MKKQEKIKNLYDFDYETQEEKKLKKKKKADAKSASKKRKKTSETKGQAEKKKKINYDDEIVIGVTRYPEKEQVKKDKKSYKKKVNNKKINKKVTKNKKTKQKEDVYSYKFAGIDNEYILDDSNKIIDEQKRARRAKIIKRILKTFSIIIVIAGAISFAMVSPIFNVNNIKISGNSKLTESEIISLSGIEQNENIFRISKSKTIKNIKQNAYVNEVSISKKIPNGIEITIEERKPSYMLEYGNAYVYINTQGYMLEVSSQKLDLPIILGYSTSQEKLEAGNRLEEEDLIKLGTVIKLMNAATNNSIANLITTINISNAENYTIYMESEKKTAYLGDCSNLETRMLYLVGIINSEKNISGEIFLNMNLNTDKAFFRESV